MLPMKRAIELSLQKMMANQGGPFGAVIAQGDRVIAEGWNQVTTLNDPTAHAEVNAIRRACRDLGTFSLRGYSIYTSCEPCPMCLSAIYWSRLDRIYFANTRDDAAKIDFDDAFLYSEIATDIGKRKIPMAQMGRDEAIKVFQIWQSKTDKVRY